MRRAARWSGVALAAATLVLAGLLVGSLLAPAGGERLPATPRRATPPVVAAAAPRPAPGMSVVATVRGRGALAVYAQPRVARRPARTLASRAAAGTPLVLLVRARRRGWLRVLLPLRPNGSSGWIRASRAILRANPYRLTVALRAHRLIVHRGMRVLLQTPIGVGRAATPTPPGLAYVTQLLRQPDPHGIYGPWAFGLSVYSPVLTSFGGGPGEVGIHGTNDPAGIGRDVSHGCIRVRNAVIERLARILPLGTPVRIIR